MANRPRILVITPVRHIIGVPEILEETGEVRYLDDPTPAEVLEEIAGFDAIFTNPNKSKVFIGPQVMDAGGKLRVIATASTGTNHIDKGYAAKKGLPILSLTEEREVINRISSTAELAFALTMAGIRHVVRGHKAVLEGDWDYTRFIGRQMNCLTVGVVGYGRLGTLYAKYCRAFDSRVLVYDPYKKVDEPGIEQVGDLGELLRQADIVALHTHVTEETTGMIDKERFAQMKSDVLIVNTSRGDVINETDAVKFLRDNASAKIATDVLADEVRNRLASPLLLFARESDQVVITPHIGGMSREAQEIAYGHTARRLGTFFREVAHAPA